MQETEKQALNIADVKCRFFVQRLRLCAGGDCINPKYEYSVLPRLLILYVGHSLL